MFNVLGSINWLSVLVAFIAYFLLGALWYMLFFPRLYRVSLGKVNESLNNQSPLFIAGPAVCVLVVVVASAILMYALGIDTYSNALLFGLLVGVGFLVSNTTNIAINPNIPQPLLYSLITSLYHLVGIILAVLIITAMR